MDLEVKSAVVVAAKVSFPQMVSMALDKHTLGSEEVLAVEEEAVASMSAEVVEEAAYK